MKVAQKIKNRPWAKRLRDVAITCYHPDSTVRFQTVLSSHMGLQPITGPTVLPYPIRFGQETPGPVYQASSTGSHQPPALCGQEHSAFFPSKSLTDAILLKKDSFVKGDSCCPVWIYTAFPKKQIPMAATKASAIVFIKYVYIFLCAFLQNRLRSQGEKKTKRPATFVAGLSFGGDKRGAKGFFAFSCNFKDSCCL